MGSGPEPSERPPPKIRRLGIAAEERPSAWARVPSAVMWITTVAASLAAVLAALNELGVFDKAATADKPAAAAAATTAEAPAPTTTPSPAHDRRPVVVRIELPDDGGQIRGFFTPRGQILTLAKARGGVAIWDDGPTRIRAGLDLVAAHGQLAVFTPVDRAGPAVDYPIRTAASLAPGEVAVLYLSAAQRTTGRVVDVRTSRLNQLRTDHERLLIATPMAALGDLCAPLLDAQDQLIGMLIGADADATYAVPVEDLRGTFPDAF